MTKRAKYVHDDACDVSTGIPCTCAPPYPVLKDCTCSPIWKHAGHYWNCPVRRKAQADAAASAKDHGKDA